MVDPMSSLVTAFQVSELKAEPLMCTQSWCTGSVVVAGGLSCSEACGILVPQPGMEPASPALQGGFPTAGPSGESQVVFLVTSLSRALVLCHSNCARCYLRRQHVNDTLWSCAVWCCHPYLPCQLIIGYFTVVLRQNA